MGAILLLSSYTFVSLVCSLHSYHDVVGKNATLFCLLIALCFLVVVHCVRMICARVQFVCLS